MHWLVAEVASYPLEGPYAYTFDRVALRPIEPAHPAKAFLGSNAELAPLSRLTREETGTVGWSRASRCTWVCTMPISRM